MLTLGARRQGVGRGLGAGVLGLAGGQTVALVVPLVRAGAALGTALDVRRGQVERGRGGGGRQRGGRRRGGRR